jgi:hypothetical protein
MHLVVAGEEYDATPGTDKAQCTAGATEASTPVTFTFENIEIEKSGKFQITVDIDSDAKQGATVTFSPSFNSSIFNADSGIYKNNARYVDAKEYVKASDVAGSISFATKLTVQAAKASLENSLTKAVEFVKDQTNRKVVFDGTYTAKK